MREVFAQNFSVQGQPIKGPLVGINDLAGLANVIVYRLVLPLAGMILLIMLIVGGYQFLLSAGNPEKVKAGRSRITAALIGFVILIVAYLVVRLISLIFGIGQGIF